MEIQVLIEPVAGNGYRARNANPFELAAEGATSEEALKQLRVLIEQRLAAGAQVIQIQLPPAAHPLARWAGTWQPGDPMIEAWKQAVEDYRQQAEEDLDQ